MLIEARFDIAFECPAPTPMLLQLNVHPSRDADLDARDPIAEKIEIGTHRQRGFRGDPVRGQQVGVAGRVDAELEDHRRHRRTFKGNVEARFDQHGPLLARVDDHTTSSFPSDEVTCVPFV